MELYAATSMDLERLYEIERVSNPTPWRTSQFLQEIELPEARVRVVRLSPDGPVAGFCCSRFIVDRTELMNIAVAPEFRRRGLARLLVEDALAWSRQRRAEQMDLEVRASNLGAQQCYLAAGFVEVGRRRRYYQNPEEDAVLMSHLFGLPPSGTAACDASAVS